MNVTYPPQSQSGLINIELGQGLEISDLLRRDQPGEQSAAPMQTRNDDGSTTVLHHYRPECGITAQGCQGGTTVTANSPGDCLEQCEQAAYNQLQALGLDKSGYGLDSLVGALNGLGLGNLGLKRDLAVSSRQQSGQGQDTVDCLGVSYMHNLSQNNCMYFTGSDSDLLDAESSALTKDPNVDTFVR